MAMRRCSSLCTVPCRVTSRLWVCTRRVSAWSRGSFSSTMDTASEISSSLSFSAGLTRMWLCTSQLPGTHQAMTSARRRWERLPTCPSRRTTQPSAATPIQSRPEVSVAGWGCTAMSRKAGSWESAEVTASRSALPTRFSPGRSSSRSSMSLARDLYRDAAGLALDDDVGHFAFEAQAVMIGDVDGGFVQIDVRVFLEGREQRGYQVFLRHERHLILKDVL